MIESSLELLGIALAAAMAARAITRERLPFGIAARLRLWLGDRVMFGSSRESKAVFVLAEINHLLTCPLCVSFWSVGAILAIRGTWSVESWLIGTGAAWIFGRAMGWENYPDNEV